MTKEEFCKYDSYISELVEKSNHTRQDLIDDLISRKVPFDVAQQIVDKHVDAKNHETSSSKPQNYILGIALMLSAVPIAAIIIWIAYKNGRTLTRRAALIPILMLINGCALINRARHQKIIK